MKFKLKLKLGYHVIRLKALMLLSPRLAAEAFFKLFCTPYDSKPRIQVPAIFHKAEKRTIIIDGISVRGFHWKATHGGNKTILICHGFNSCCYKFEKYVQGLLQQGLNVLAFDAPGHGISDGKQINALLYSRTIIQIAKEHGPLHGIMGHSLGGLAASFAAEKLQQPEIKVVLIAPATETTTAVQLFLNAFKVNNITLRNEVFEIIEREGGYPVSWFSAARAIQTISNPVLWVHDKHDRICLFTDTDKIREVQPKHLSFVTTERLGHNKIYRDVDVQKKVLEFFSEPV